jgi:hypothetical protein
MFPEQEVKTPTQKQGGDPEYICAFHASLLERNFIIQYASGTGRNWQEAIKRYQAEIEEREESREQGIRRKTPKYN